MRIVASSSNIDILEEIINQMDEIDNPKEVMQLYQ
jgi:hypothetical protein